MNISQLRQQYHQEICSNILRITQKQAKEDYPNFADGDSSISCRLAWGIVERIGCEMNYGKLPGQTAGKRFEVVTRDFLENAFSLLTHLRPGQWQYLCENTAIANFDQYHHLSQIEEMFKSDATLGSAFGGSYIVRPDIVISRMPVSDTEVDEQGILSNSSERHAGLTPLRSANYPEDAFQILHAVVSCKWTIRHDRAQNTRTEVLNLVRHRKGNLPHVVAVTAEPFPSRIAALALGTGDLDCVYHMALPELLDAVKSSENEESQEILDMMVSGRRLRDISDLPFDLAV